MKKNLLLFFFFVSSLSWSGFVFGQEQIKNISTLPNDIVKQKLSFVDSVRNATKTKEQQDATYYKSMLEDGFSRTYIDSLRHKNDPSFKIPIYYSDPDETIVHSVSKKHEHDKLVNHPSSYGLKKHLYEFNKTNSPREISVNHRNNTNKMGDPPVPMITGPEQNCPGAIPVCQQTYTQSQSYTGYGYQEVYGTCLLAREQYSVWYVFTVQSSGTFGFDLTTLKDYDYALYNLTTIGGCSYVPTSTPVRCNYSSTFGNTGLTASSTSELPALSVNAAGAPYMTGLQVTAGNTYALIIDNFTMDATGYTLAFTGTSSIYDTSPPTINPPNTVVNNCNGTITITFSEPVQCNSIAANGSDFTISGGGSITGASGCTAGTLTNQITISYTAPSSGTFTIGIKVGSDGNTILDKCGNAMSTSQTVNFNHLANLSGITSVPASGTICQGSSIVLTANGAPGGATFAWNPAGGTTNPSASVTPAASTIYDVTVSYGGCTKNASYTVTVQAPPVVSISPMNPILCSGTTVLTASGNPCTGCTYNWTGSWTGTGASTPAYATGTFNVTATSSIGCVSSMVSSTISQASTPPANFCSIYYVTPSGAGTADGTSIANAASAATLPTLLSSVACGGATIKMAVGVYSISDALTMNSNTTLEGGYNAAFTTKTSDMSTSNATTIRRSNATGDGGSGTTYSAIKVTASATNFRIQDVRIEMPGATPLASNPVHAAGSQKTNYAINLGAGCSSYNIVRCYIDGGQGANQ